MGKRQTPRQQRRKCPDFRHRPPQQKPLPSPAENKPALKSPGKIPVLSGQEELPSRFGLTEEVSCFAEAVESTLADPALREIFLEKGDSIPPASPRADAELLRRYPTPETQLDLHGCTAPEAEAKAMAFIIAAQRNGLRTLRLITGKGRHSQGRPVLPDVVEQVAMELRKKRVVLSFHWEKKSKHKSGALILHLR